MITITKLGCLESLSMTGLKTVSAHALTPIKYKRHNVKQFSIHTVKILCITVLWTDLKYNVEHLHFFNVYFSMSILRRREGRCLDFSMSILRRRDGRCLDFSMSILRRRDGRCLDFSMPILRRRDGRCLDFSMSILRRRDGRCVEAVDLVNVPLILPGDLVAFDLTKNSATKIEGEHSVTWFTRINWPRHHCPSWWDPFSCPAVKQITTALSEMIFTDRLTEARMLIFIVGPSFPTQK